MQFGVKKELKRNLEYFSIVLELLLLRKDYFLKKTTHILFTIVFTVVTLGFTVNKHYSGGELFSFSIFSEPESCCADVCNCCDEESETVQFLVDYTFSSDTFESSPDELELFTLTPLLAVVEPELVLKTTELIDQNLPPPDNLTTLSYFQSYLL